MFEQTIQRYFQALETSDYDGLMELFAPEAVVFSPLYGERKAVEFYQELFKDTASSKITLLRVFESGTTGAVLFRYDWVLKNGTSTFFECVDILEFSQGKIQSLKIIYDTSPVHILLSTSKPSTVEGTAGEVAA